LETFQQLGNLGSARRHATMSHGRVESRAVSIGREPDESKTPLSPLRLLTDSATNRHLQREFYIPSCIPHWQIHKQISIERALPRSSSVSNHVFLDPYHVRLN
jgi:hypothetical protein